MNSYLVAPVEKAAKVFRCLASTAGPMTLKGLCGELCLPKTTVFRYLRTLEHCGFVTHDRARDLYQLDVDLLGLVGSSLALQRLRRAALPHLQRLCDEFGETANLGVLDGADIVYLEIVSAPGALRTFTRVGGRDPLHATALGKAILAGLPAERRDAALPPRLRKMTDRTLSCRAELDDELARVRACGHAIERAENEDGATCIGAAIHDPTGGVHAALSLSFPCERLSAERLQATGAALAEAAVEISLTWTGASRAAPVVS